MENVIVKEVEKIITTNPPVAPTKNGVIISLEFAKEMECFDYSIKDDDIIINTMFYFWKNSCFKRTKSKYGSLYNN